MKSISIVTSLPLTDEYKSFFETTELFCRSVRRVDQTIPLYVFVPAGYNKISKEIINELNLKVIYQDLLFPTLLVSNILAEIPKHIDEEYFMYFTTENLVLKEINYMAFTDDTIYVPLVEIEDDNPYFTFVTTLQSLYSGIKPTNKMMALEYMIAGKTNSTLWKEFFDLSVNILKFLESEFDKVSKHYSSNVLHHIIPSTDLVSLNIIHQLNNYNFQNLPNSFISLHDGLPENYQSADAESIFYQYSGFDHHRMDLLLDLPDNKFKQWLGKQLFAVDPHLAINLCRS